MARPRIMGFERLAELEGFLSGFDGQVRFIAGGTDLLPDRIDHEALLIDLSRMAELDFIKKEDGWVRIGPGVTMARLAADPIIREQGLCLAQAAGKMGSAQIRNRATIGGNLGTGSPAADTLPPLTALRAEGRVLRWSGPEPEYDDHLLIDICGPRISPQELITEVRFPVAETKRVSGFVKVGSRTALTIAKLSLALAAERDPAGERIARGRIALGALGELPICPDNLEFFLEDRPIDPNLGPDLAHRLKEIVDGAIPDRASLAYKRLAVQGLAHDLVDQVFGPGGGS